MKPLRVFLISAGILVAIVVLFTVLALNSGVQTWAARRVLAAQPDVTGEIGRIDVGLHSVTGDNVTVRASGLVLTLPHFEADLSVLGAARERFEVRRLVARGWTLDLTAPALAQATSAPARSHAGVLPVVLAAQTPDATSAQAVPAADLLAALQLPVDLIALDNVELEGTIILGTPDGPARLQARITGGELSLTSVGRFRVQAASISLPASDSGVSALRLEADVSARLDTPRRFAQLAIESDLHAEGPRFPQPVGLRVDAAAGADPDQPAVYSFDVRRGDQVLLDVDARPEAAEPDGVEGTWRVALTAADLAPFTLGFAVPDFAAGGDGTVAINARDGGVMVAGALQVSTTDLRPLHAGLGAVEPLEAAIEFEARRVGDNVRVTRLRTVVTGRQPVMELTTRQGLEYSLSTGELRVADPDAELVDINVQGVPLAWAEPFLDGYAVSGGAVQGAWTAAARDGGFSLRPTASLRVGKVTVRSGQQTLVQDLDIAASISGEFLPSGWQARVEQGQVATGRQRLLSFDARAGRAAAPGAALVATSRYTADLGGWLAQPGAAQFRVFRSGTAVGEFIVALSEKIELAAELEVANLVGPDGEALPQTAIDVRADVGADGRVEAHVPVRVTQNGRASDLTLDAQARPAGDGWHLTALAAGQHLFLQDLELLLLPLAAREGAAEPEIPGGPAGRPIWSGLEGQLSFTFGTVVYSEALTVTNVTGEIELGPEALEIAGLQAALPTGGEFRFQGGLQFEPQAAEPYVLRGEVAASGVEVGNLMTALAPGSTPPVEGRFDLVSTVTGRAADLAALAENTNAEARLSSRGGTLRALSVTVAEYTRSASALANVAGLIGSLTGDTRAQRVKAALDLADQLANLNFDQLNIEITREAGDEIRVKDLSLISPAIRLLGSGTIGDQPGRALWHEPLNLRLQLSAREGVAENLRTLRLLQETADTLGYLPMSEELTLEGSLANISRAQLQSLISRALSQ